MGFGGGEAGLIEILLKDGDLAGGRIQERLGGLEIFGLLSDGGLQGTGHTGQGGGVGREAGGNGIGTFSAEGRVDGGEAHPCPLIVECVSFIADLAFEIFDLGRLGPSKASSHHLEDEQKEEQDDGPHNKADDEVLVAGGGGAAWRG